MNRLLLALLFLLVGLVPWPASAGMTLSPGTTVHTHSDANTGGGTLALGGTLSSTKACATGFTRAGPNYCKRTNAPGESWTNATACTARTFTAAVPADATAVLIGVTARALANNAIGQRLNSVQFYSSSACTGASALSMDPIAYEFSATAASTVIAQWTFFAIAPLPATNTIYTKQTNAGGNGNVDVTGVTVLGYFD